MPGGRVQLREGLEQPTALWQLMQDAKQLMQVSQLFATYTAGMQLQQPVGIMLHQAATM